MSSNRHSSEQYSGTGDWSMTVFVRAGPEGRVDVGAAETVEEASDFFEASSFEGSERLMVPLGLTRPVPCTRPPPVRAARRVLLRFMREGLGWVVLVVSAPCAFGSVWNETEINDPNAG